MEPTFCPNPSCIKHHADSSSSASSRFWVCVGSYHTQVVGSVPRFRCKACGRGFSVRTFALDYFTKKSLDNIEIHRAISAGESIASIARHLRCSADSIRNRLDRLGRGSIALHADLTDGLKLTEDLAADGFESFDRSQFFPNNINLLVGVDSQFLYGATHTSLRRKGSMTDAQRRRRAVYDAVFRPAASGVRDSFSRLVAQIPVFWDQAVKPKLELRTDEHRAYSYSIQTVKNLASALACGSLTHRTYSSKTARTTMNPLFPVNYYDRELRKDIAAYRRESTCCTRNTSSGLLRLCSHLSWHNYMKNFRVDEKKWFGITHGERAGIERCRIEKGVEKLFGDRPFISRVKLSSEWVDIWLKKRATPLKQGTDYVPRFASVGHTQASRY